MVLSKITGFNEQTIEAIKYMLMEHGYSIEEINDAIIDIFSELESLDIPVDYVENAVISQDGTTLTLTLSDGTEVAFAPSGGGSEPTAYVVSLRGPADGIDETGMPSNIGRNIGSSIVVNNKTGSETFWYDKKRGGVSTFNFNENIGPFPVSPYVNELAIRFYVDYTNSSAEEVTSISIQTGAFKVDNLVLPYAVTSRMDFCLVFRNVAGTWFGEMLYKDAVLTDAELHTVNISDKIIGRSRVENTGVIVFNTDLFKQRAECRSILGTRQNFNNFGANDGSSQTRINTTSTGAVFSVNDGINVVNGNYPNTISFTI